MSGIVSNFLIVGFFLVGYMAIILEFYLKVNKTAVGIAIAGVCWMFFFLNADFPISANMAALSHHLSDISEIIFFLLGAMTLVELIDSHKGFNTVIRLIHTRSKRQMLIVISILAFFLSAILDNLTTTILMISVLRKLVPFRNDRTLLNIMVVIAANAGGAWTPIGDVTTTMLWINGRVTTLSVMQAVIVPSLIAMIIPMLIYLFSVKGQYPEPEHDFASEQKEPGATVVFVLGLLSLISVPVIKWLTGMPPFMGMLLALALLWLVTDLIHFRYEDRQHLRIPFILTKIDVSSILFFLGILLSIDALESVGLLKQVALWLDTNIQNPTLIASAIGVFSAIIDNVPLVAATMGMYDSSVYPVDDSFWLLTAFAAGTGGSMLSIGSAAGVALMGIEKLDFITYCKKATIPSFIGFAAGVLFYYYVF